MDTADDTMVDCLHMCNGFPAKMTTADYHGISCGDVTRESLVCKREGYIKEKCNQTGEFGCSGIVVWLFRNTL